MSSSGFPDLLDLERGLPTSLEDVETLKRLRRPQPMTLEEYFRFCENLPQPSAEQLARHRSVGAPFSLE
jgi:hypothetical protein